MNKPLLFTGILMMVAVSGMAQQKIAFLEASELPVPRQHYQPEYTFDKPSDPASWTRLKPGLHAALGSTDELYMRCEVPAIPETSNNLALTGWKGERLNAQVLIWSPDSIGQIRLRASDLVNSGGKMIGSAAIKMNMVRYVVSNFPYGAAGFTCDVSSDSSWLMPDRLEPFERFDLPGNTVRPVWVSFDIPPDAEAGTYSGTLNIVSPGDKVSLNVSLRVQNQVLPDPHDWKFRLDLWQNPWVIAWYYNIEPWSEEHKVLLKNHLKLYAGAGGKYITTYAVHSPWSDNSYMIEGTMIDWIKTKQGSWKFDYSIFDQYVQLAMEAGIDNAITIYTPIPWGNRFRYRDENSGDYVYEEWTPTSEPFKSFWNLFLDDLKTHLTQKGWFGKTYLGINENPLDYTIAAAKLIKEHSKEWKITYAGDWHQELTNLLDDYSPVISSEPSPPELKQRIEKGFTTTYYVCCTPAKPNNFVFSPPVESRYIGWYALAYGYSGFLRWAYDAWPADPVRDARHTYWPAGDCFLVYPGANSSIRFEKLREGISDYEKILILRDKSYRSGSKSVMEQMEALEALLKTFVSERDYSKRNYHAASMTEDLIKGNGIITILSDELGKK